MIYVGGYHEYRGGCSVPWGTQIIKDFSPHGTEHPPRYSRYPPTFIMISPHGTEHPHGTQDIPHGTQDIPHGTHDIPPRY